MSMNKIEIKILNHRVKDVPDYATAGSAGMDLRSLEDVYINPGETHKFPLGWAMYIGDHEVCALLAPRSSLGIKGIHLSNLIGIIDSDYQGELIVNLTNNSRHPEPYFIEEGDRIAQLLFLPVRFVNWMPVVDFSHETARGTGGFGSTGKR